jgi:glycerate dehydrogenase
MNLTILDGYLVNSGDLSWEPIQAFGQCDIYDRTLPEDIVARAKNADVILTNKCLITKDVIQALPKLKHIIVLATGTNNIDIDAAKQANITVNNIVGYSTHAVAQHVFAMLLSITNAVDLHNASVKTGDWAQCIDFSYRLQPLIELNGLSMGIVGFGNIGQAVAKIARSFNMKVLIHSQHADPKDYPDYHFLTRDELFKQSDVISLHCPLTEKTKHLINATTLKLMKPSAILLNTSRGAVVDEQALAGALNNEQLHAAAIDVLSTEPPGADNPLLHAKRCLITPHIAWGTKTARERIVQQAAEHLSKHISAIL